MENSPGLVSLYFKTVGIGTGGDSGEWWMGKAKGVTIVVLSSEGKESGTKFSLGASGVSIKLK